MDRDITVEKFRMDVEEYCESRVREYNGDVVQIVRVFVCRVVEDGLVNSNKKYLDYVFELL